MTCRGLDNGALLRCTGWRITSGDDPADDTIGVDGYRGVGDQWERTQRSLDLSEFDAVAAYLHLAVDAAEVFEDALSTADQIARPVHACARQVTGRVRDEGARGAGRAAEIPTGERCSAHVQFAYRAVGYTLQRRVEDEEIGTRDRTSDRCRTGGRVGNCGVIGDDDGGLGRTIGVDQCERRCRGEYVVDEFGA